MVFHVRIPRSLVRFLAGELATCRVTVGAGRNKHIIYASRGMRYVVIRATARDRPWQCYRVSGSTDSWDRGTYADREDYIVAFLRKLQRPAQGAVDKPDAHDPELAGKFPALHEHLTRSRDDDGKPRQTCSLTIYGQQGAFRAFLNDRDSGASLGVTGGTLQGLLGALEAELESPEPNWFWRQGGDSHPAKNRGKRG